MDNIYWMCSGKYQKDYDELWERLVPSRGNAATKAGEVLRAVSRIYYRWYNDGDRIQPRLNESVAVSAIKAFKYLYQFLDLGSGFSTRKLMEDIVFADTEEDYELALQMLRSYPKQTQLTINEDIATIFGEEDVEKIMRKPLDSTVHPFDPKDDRYESGSTDVGDVGYATPTVELNIATACLGNVGHTWQNTAFSCSPIGFKGMIRAAEVLTLAAVA